MNTIGVGFTSRILYALIFLFSTAAYAQNANPPAAGGSYQVFREYFDRSAPSQDWTVYSQSAATFRWQSPGEQPGFHYQNTQYGPGYGYSTWNVGTQPFDLKFDVNISVGMLHEYIRNGVAVALSTNPPDKQGPGDISTVVAIQGAGPGASVRKGPLFMKDTELSNITKWPVGGDVESIAWPNTRIANTQLTVEMQRLPGNVMVYSVYRPDYKDGLQPWWTRSWTLPANLAGTAFNTLIVETLSNCDTNGNGSCGKPAVDPPPAAYTYQGTVSNIRGYVPGAEAPPGIMSTAPVSQILYQTGAAVTVTGQGFQPGATVRLDNQYLDTTYISATQLSVVLPALPSGNYRLKVLNPNGLEGEIVAGITYSGPTVLRVEPREASPAGGDIVTLVGAGFDSDTQVTVGGLTASIVQVVDAFHLQVRVPGGNPGLAVVQVQGNGAAFAGSPVFGYAQHPYMHYSSNGLAALQQKFNDPQYADYQAILLRNATDADPNNPKGAMADYLWPYLMTGNPLYRASLFNKISLEIDRLDFTDFRLMDASLMATAYDTLFPELTPQQRASFLSYLDRAFTVYNQMRADNAWFLGPAGNNISNTTAAANSAGGQIAIALRNSTAGTANVINDAVKRILPFANRCIAADGGDVEGPLYWNFGLTWYLQLGHVLQTATGDDHALLAQPNLQKNYRFIETTLTGNGLLATFNDSEPQLYGMAVTADLGTRQNQPLMLWMSDYLAHRNAANPVEDEASRYDIAPYAFLWRGGTAAPAAFPGVPTSSLLQNMNWGILRSGSELQPNLVVAVKGASGDLTHHAQQDVGSFVLQAGGEEFFIDPGYYQGAAAKHSVPLIDGAGPGISGSTIGGVADADGIRSMVVDSTQAYGGKAQRVRRIVVLYADQAAVILDDIVPAANKPGIVSSQFQTVNRTRSIPGPGFSVQGAQTQVSAVLNGPAASVVTSGPVDFAGSWVYKAQNAQWYSTAVNYTADPNKPLITVISPSALGAVGNTAAVTWSPGRAEVSFTDGRTILFTLGPNGWQL